MADKPGDDPLHLVGAGFIALALKYLWGKINGEADNRPCEPEPVPIPHTAGEVAYLRAQLEIQGDRIGKLEAMAEEILRLLKGRGATAGD